MMAARLTTFLVVGIVAATLIAGLIVGAQRDDADGPIDLIIHNASLYTADADGTMAEAIAVRGNQIVRVGSNRDVLRLRRPQTEVIDASHGAVVPGFNDAHVHFIAGGLTLDKIDLLDAATLEEVQQRVREWAAANPDEPWVLGRGWPYHLFPGGLPTRQMLDTLVPDRPAYIVSHDGRTAWVNSKALTRAGISRRTPDAANAIVKDVRTGEPTGVLKEGAMSLMNRVAPTPTRDDRASALRGAILEAQRYGITSVQVAGVEIDDLELYDEAARADELEVRVYAVLSAHGALDAPALERLESLKRKYADSPLLKAGALKITLDGVIEAHTAAMLEPHANRVEPGSAAIGADALNRSVRLADARGWQVMTHAADDRAVRMALDAYAHAVRSNPLPARGRRHRIEHAGAVDSIDIPRFGALGVIASMQPSHATQSPAEVDLRVRHLGAARASRGWPARAIVADGGQLAFGSDWPSFPLNPMLGIQAAVNRWISGPEREGSRPSTQKGALQSAIKAYTSGAARASFDEQRKGTLEPGMLADIVVLSHDIFDPEITPDILESTRPVITVFDGKVRYRRDRIGTN